MAPLLALKNFIKVRLAPKKKKEKTPIKEKKDNLPSEEKSKAIRTTPDTSKKLLGTQIQHVG